MHINKSRSAAFQTSPSPSKPGTTATAQLIKTRNLVKGSTGTTSKYNMTLNASRSRKGLTTSPEEKKKRTGSNKPASNVNMALYAPNSKQSRKPAVPKLNMKKVKTIKLELDGSIETSLPSNPY